MQIRLLPREPPLTADGVVTCEAVGALAAATGRCLDRGSDLRVASGAGWLLILGAAAELPWADGCVYLGREGRVLIPTTCALDPHPDLVAAALGSATCVVLEDVILRGPTPVGPVDRAWLAART